MAFIEPSGTCYLLNNVGLSNDYMNTYTWRTAVEQSNFFMTKRVFEVTNCRYIKQTQQLKVPFEYDRIYMCDYVMYQNLNYHGKWFYAFIVRKTYVNDGTTLLDVEIDAMQTWYFDIVYHPSYVVRRHTRQLYSSNNQVDFTNNTYPEGLEFGGMYETVHTKNIPFVYWYCLICSTVALDSNPGDVSNPNLVTSRGGVFDRVPSMLNYYVIDNLPGNGSTRTSRIDQIFNHLAKKPWIAQCIQSVTMIPKECVGQSWNVVNLYDSALEIGELQYNYTSPNFTIPDIDNYLNYFPNYNWSKLYAYPYSYIEMTCYNGQSIIIRPELVGSNNLEIRMLNYVGSMPRMAFYVYGYGSQNDNGFEIQDGELAKGEFLNNAVIMSNYPQLPVMVDNYLLYMANNANQISLTYNLSRWNQKEGMVKSGISGLSSILGGNIFGGLMSGAMGMYDSYKQGEVEVRKQAAQIQDAEINPPSLAGMQGGDAFNIANGITGVTLKWKTIKNEYRVRLEHYFERYGYLYNVIEMPSLRGMSIFNYLQTMDINITGNIPDEDLNKIKKMFNDGVTLWHNHDAGNYVIGTNRWTGV